MSPVARMGGVGMVTAAERAAVGSELANVVEHRKSGLSLNWVIGCPLNCAYCVRHLLGNWAMTVPRALMSEQDAAAALFAHPHFEAHRTPLQVLNRATDPMLPAVKPHTMAMLRLLDEAGLRNHVLVISRFRVTEEDCAAFNALRTLRVSLLCTYSGITDRRIEPVASQLAADSLRTAYAHAQRYRVLLYWRPIVPGLNDSEEHLRRAVALSEHAHATVFTGLFYRGEIRDYYRAHGLPEPYGDTARRKILPAELEQRILAAFAGRVGGSALFRKTSCAVSYAHGLPDYNGHYGIRDLCDICPAAQVRRCAGAHTRPAPARVAELAGQLGGTLVGISDGAVIVAGLGEQERYRLQHELGFQVHDVEKPHHPGRHGRADLGWPRMGEAPG